MWQLLEGFCAWAWDSLYSWAGLMIAILGIVQFLEFIFNWKLPVMSWKSKLFVGFIALEIMQFSAYKFKSDELTAVQRSPVVPNQWSSIEPPDSLRRRAKQLTEKIVVFFASRKDGHPPYTTGKEEASAEQQKINRTSEVYDAKTQSICAVKFHDQFSGIASEMGSKGLDVQWLDSSVHLCPNEQDLSIMRELSFHLDERDNAVRF